MSAEELLEQVQGAASEAAEKLTLKRPSSTVTASLVFRFVVLFFTVHFISLTQVTPSVL